MRRSVSWLLCLLLSLLSACSSLPAQSARELRVMSFNVRLLTDADGPNRWEARRDLMVDTIRAQHPDVLGTQELFAEQGAYLATQLPEYRWFGRGRERDGGGEHMGVFYRHAVLRVIESGDFWLSDTPEVPGSITWGHPHPRMVTWALFERIDDGRRFYFFNTHLPYRDDDEPARERGARLLLQRIAALPTDPPIVVTGDFNTVPASPTHVALTDVLQDAWETTPQRAGPAATFHAFSGRAEHRIDWILLRGMQARRVETLTDHARERYPSDHFPVMALLEWPPAP